MAATGKFNASDIKIEIGVPPVSPATTITVWKGVSDENTCTFDLSINEIDTTTKYNDGFADSIPGLIKGTISGEATVNNAIVSTRYTSGDIMGMALARAMKTFRIGTADDNDPREVFTGFFTKFSKKADMESVAKFNFEISMTSRPVPAA